jgi:hypothetical protein
MVFRCLLIKKSRVLRAFSSHTGAFATTDSGIKKKKKNVHPAWRSKQIWDYLTASLLALERAGCLGNSSRPSLGEKSMYDLDRHLGVMVDDASSTEFEKTRYWTSRRCQVRPLSSSFFLVNQRLRPLAWTLIASVAAVS